MANKVSPYIYFRIKTNFIRSSNLSVYEKTMFMVLLTYKNCKEIFASQSELAKHAGMSRYKAIQVLGSLTEKGYIAADNNTNHKTVVYRILNEALVNTVDTPVNDVDTAVNENDTTCQPQPQVPVNDVDINKNKIKRDKLIIKTKKSDLDVMIDNIMLEWIEISGQVKIQLTTDSFRKQIRGRIAELKRDKKDNGSIREAFTYVFTNKKAQAEDDDYRRFSIHDWNLTTLTRPRNFMPYLVEPEYGKEPEGETHEEYINRRIKEEEEGNGKK